jgi:hypothetical protein
MKSNLKIIGVFCGAFLFSLSLNAQNTKEAKPVVASDVNAGYTYDFDKANKLIIERITNPNTTNTDVQVFLDQPDFPKLPKGKTIDATYKEHLSKWMEKNPDLIINTLKSRKDIVTQY